MRKRRTQLKKGMQKAVLSASLLLCGTAAMAQSQKSGVITDSNGEPLVGVTVVEQGTTNGTVTDANGRYTITTTKPGAKLKVSYVGYLDRVITPGQNAVLKDDNKMLNEVVVVGYGTMRRKDVTSSITTVKAEGLNKGVYSDAASLLQGKVAGLVVTTSGDPNGTPSITLRGASSLRTGEAMQPYYVIDGIPGVDISMVSPDDIESIDVLRDATATAIYGSKAANGVIIINTKKGRKGEERTSVSYNGYAAFDHVAKTLDMASAGDLRGYAKANGLTLGNDEGANVDWQKEVLRTGVSHNHNLSISGGGQKSTYMVSLNYQNRQGIVKESGMNRLNVRSLMTTKVLKDHLDISLGVNGMYGTAHGVPMWNEGASVLDAMNYYSPCMPVRGEDGNWSKATGSKNYNPMSLLHEDTFETNWKRMQYIAKASLKIIDGLTWNANYSFTNNQHTYSAYDTHNTQIEGVSAYNGKAARNTYMGHAHTFETYGNYDVTISKIHKLSVMAGYSWEEKESGDGFGLWVHDFYDDYLKWNQLSYASSIDGIEGYREKYLVLRSCSLQLQQPLHAPDYHPPRR